MKVGGGLQYVVGPMGAGKSFYAVRKIVAAAIAGKYCVTNVELYPDFAERIARHYAHLSQRKRAIVAYKAASAYIYEADLAEAMKYRLPGRGEARGLFVWDETHNDLNNRSWRADGRGELLEWATQLRKLGYSGFLLSQSADNTDAQLRRICNFVVRLQNQREQTRMLGVRVTPWPLFLACWYPAHTALGVRQVKPERIERYFLGWQRHLYDTHGLYHGLANPDAEADVHLLPPIGAGRVAPQALPPAPAHEGTV